MSAPILNENNVLNDENYHIILNDDIIFEVIEQLKNDSFSSFNCLLVNKRWCRIVVSILWKNPFRLCKSKKGYHLIVKAYITHFDKEDRHIFNALLSRDQNDCMLNDHDYPTTFFEYGKYLKEFKLREVKRGIDAWACNSKYNITNYLFPKFEICIMQSMIRQCQRLEYVEWNILFLDKCFSKVLQPKILDLKNLSFYYDKDDIKFYNVDYINLHIKEVFNIFKNSCQKLSDICLTFEHHYKRKHSGYNNEHTGQDLITEEFNSLVKSQHGLKSLTFKHKCDSFVDIIKLTLESHANTLTKLVLGDVDFNKISFDSFEKCANLEHFGLKFSKGLELESCDHYTMFQNLKMLELSLNEWSSEVTAMIIRKAGINLTSLTIGEGNVNHTINDDTLTALTKYCPEIQSLSISQISEKSFNKLFSYIKDLKLKYLQIYQIEGKTMKSKDLLDYIEHQKSLSKIGINKNDTYWNYYDGARDRFKNFLKKHNIRIVYYRPFSHIENLKIARLGRDEDYY